MAIFVRVYWSYGDRNTAYPANTTVGIGNFTASDGGRVMVSPYNGFSNLNIKGENNDMGAGPIPGTVNIPGERSIHYEMNGWGTDVLSAKETKYFKFTSEYVSGGSSWISSGDGSISNP